MRASRHVIVAAAAVCIVFGAAAITRGGEWPRFLGPVGTGVIEGEKIVRQWPDGGPKEVWKIDVGPGFGGASIADGAPSC